MASPSPPEVEAFLAELSLSEEQKSSLVRDHGQINLPDSALALACHVAAVALPVETSLPNTSDYDLLTKGNWSAACWLKPHCIISPATANSVAKALRILTFFRAPFAVRSGGHSPNPGWASIEKGILIDLSRLKKLELSPDRKLATVGPGNHWIDVYDYLEPEGVTVAGGRIAPVGVGGLTLGGGISFFTNKYGLTCDTVESFEIVLADSSIVQVDAHTYPDLFWALKGGGPNFGIVTSFTFRTVPHEIYYEASTYPVSESDSLLEAIEKYQNDGQRDVNTGVLYSASTAGVIWLGLLYAGRPTKDTLAKVFQPFYDVSSSTAFLAPVYGTQLGLCKELVALFSDKPRHDYRAASSGVNSAVYKEVFSYWVNATKDVPAEQTFSMQCISKSAIEAGEKAGGNSMGLSCTHQLWWTTVIDWMDESDDEKVRSTSIRTTQAWKEISEKYGVDVAFQYMNDASRDQIPVATYRSANIEKLIGISAKYDPNQVFQTLQKDGPLLSKF